MGRHTTGSRAKCAPVTAAEAARRFREDTGLDLANDPRFVEINQHMLTWRAALVVAEFEPLAEAIENTDQAIRARALRAIPKCEPIRVDGPPSEQHAKAQALAAMATVGVQKISDGLKLLRLAISEALETDLIGKAEVGRPEDALPRALCMFLVEAIERGGVLERVTSTQAALIAHAYGIAAPAGTWKDWLERWRRMMNEARAEQPGSKTPRQRVIGKVHASREALIPKR